MQPAGLVRSLDVAGRRNFESPCVKPLAKFISSSRVRYHNATRRHHGTTQICSAEVFHASTVEICPLNLTAPGIRPAYFTSRSIECNALGNFQPHPYKLLYHSAVQGSPLDLTGRVIHSVYLAVAQVIPLSHTTDDYRHHRESRERMLDRTYDRYCPFSHLLI